MATDKQVADALDLLKRKGFAADSMGPSHKRIATTGERKGSVEAWLRKKSATELAVLISVLRDKPDKEIKGGKHATDDESADAR